MEKNKKYISATGSLILILVLAGATMAHGADLSVEDQIGVVKQTGNVTDCAKLLKQIESLWPDQPENYFRCQNQLGAILESMVATNTKVDSLLNEQAKTVLNKKCPDDISGLNECVSAKGNSVQVLAELTKSAPSIPVAEMLAKTLGEIRSLIITNYQWEMVTANVAPPIVPPLRSTNGMQVMFSGMSANSIQDPAAREAYQKAIAENKRHNQDNWLQTQLLPGLNRKITVTFLNYAKNALAHDTQTAKHADVLAKQAHLNEQEREQIQSTR